MSLDRTTVTLVLGFLGILVVGGLRPEGPENWDRVHPKRLWARKVGWGPDHDVVFAGDSRVAFGIAPDEVGALLPGRRVANFGFLGCGYDASYLAAIDGVLDPASQAPVVVLGFSPRSIVPDETWTNEYTEARDLSIDERLLLVWCSEELWDYRRMELEEIQGWFGPPAPPEEATYVLHDDGFVETLIRDPEHVSRQDRMAPLTDAVDAYPPVLVEAVAAAVERWTARGVRVYGYRSPCPPERAANEDALYRFDEPALRRAFEDAGGTWWEVSSEGLTYWDSSHMDGPSARRFSQRLGARLTRE